MVKDILLQKNFFRVFSRVIKWHFRFVLTKKSFPLACGFYLTSKCNFRCEFCNIWRIQPAFQFSEEDARKIIAELGKMGLIYFSLSGGEPLLVPYVFDLLAYAKKSGILYTHIVSNGYLMDKDKARALKEAQVSEISFSIDAEEAKHDKNRGMVGAYQKVLEAVECVKNNAPKTRIVLNTILDPVQPENALYATRIAGNLGVKIKIQPINDHPDFSVRDCAVKSRRSLQKEERQRLIEAIDLIQQLPQVANSKPFLKNYLAFMFSPENLIFSRDDCIFGYHHIEFFNNQMFPCLEGLNWQDGFKAPSDETMEKVLKSGQYCSRIKQLRKCSFCKRSYYVCYYEPRLNFPIWNFFKARLNAPKIKAE